MQVVPFIGCAAIGLVSAVFGFDVRGVATRYLRWRYANLKARGLRPNPSDETEYVALSRRYLIWGAIVFVPLGVLGAVAAALAQ